MTRAFVEIHMEETADTKIHSTIHQLIMWTIAVWNVLEIKLKIVELLGIDLNIIQSMQQDFKWCQFRL